MSSYQALTSPVIQQLNFAYYRLFTLLKDSNPEMQKAKLPAYANKKHSKALIVQNIQASKFIPNFQPSSEQNDDSQASSTSKSISSKQSAFWPFTQSFEENNFLSHIISQKLQPSQLIENFVEDPTQKVFERLKKTSASADFSIDQIVLAKCVDEPLWPGKIIKTQNISGLVPYETVYHVKFINESNFCIVDKSRIIKFNQHSMEELRKVTENKKLLRAIKLAEKYFQEQQDEQSNENEKIQQKSEQKPEEPQFKQTQVQLSLSSLEVQHTVKQKEKSSPKDIEVSEKGFYVLKNIFSNNSPETKLSPVNHQVKLKTPEIPTISTPNDVKIIKNDLKQMTSFKPIVLYKGQTMEIKLNDDSSSKETEQNSNKSSQVALRNKIIQNSNQTLNNENVANIKESKSNKTPQSVHQKDQKIKVKPLKRCPGSKPINLVLETPRLNAKQFYLNKIIVRFNQPDKLQSKQQYQVKPQDNDLNETVLQDSNKSKKQIIEQNSKQIKITKKVEQLKGKHQQKAPQSQSSKKSIDKILAYITQYIQEIDGLSEMISKQRKQRDILEYLSLPLQKTLKSRTYIIYDKILNHSIEIINKSQLSKKNQLFSLNLRHKLKSIWQFLSTYNSENCFINRIKNKNLSKLDSLFTVTKEITLQEKKDISKKATKTKQNKSTQKQKPFSKQNQKIASKKTHSKEQKISEQDERIQKQNFKIKLKKMMVLSYEESITEQDTSTCPQQPVNLPKLPQQ